jgi:hypothetical protein
VTAETDVRSQLVVALYGRSLMLAGLGRRLARQPHLRVVAVDGPSVCDALGPLVPDVLMVDLGAASIESALAALRDRPDLLLVGLEAGGARLLVLSGEQASTVGTDDLVALIERGRVVGWTGGR